MEPETFDFTGLPGYQLFRCRVAIAGCFTGDLLSQVSYTPKYIFTPVCIHAERFFFMARLPWAIRGDIANDDKQYPGTTNFRKTGSSQCAVVFYFFRFGQFFPILAISASAKVIVAAIHGA